MHISTCCTYSDVCQTKEVQGPYLVSFYTNFLLEISSNHTALGNHSGFASEIIPNVNVELWWHPAVEGLLWCVYELKSLYIMMFLYTFANSTIQLNNRKGPHFSHKSFIAIKRQETSFRFWPVGTGSPQTLQYVSPEASSDCWRCRREKTTMFHIFWQCPNVRLLWQDVTCIIK